MWLRYKLYKTMIRTSRHPTISALAFPRDARAQVEQQLQGQAASDLRDQLLGWYGGYRWYRVPVVPVRQLENVTWALWVFTHLNWVGFLQQDVLLGRINEWYWVYQFW